MAEPSGIAVAVGDPGFIPSAGFAGAKLGYAFKSGAQGMGYYKSENTSAPIAPVPAQMKELPPGLISVAQMDGSWTAEGCFCSNPALYVTVHSEAQNPGVLNPDTQKDGFSTMSPGWCGWLVLDGCMCLGGHPTRMYTRSPGTNNFQCESHSATLVAERTLKIDGITWSWIDGESWKSKVAWASQSC